MSISKSDPDSSTHTNNLPKDTVVFNLKTLTPVWTGGADRNDRTLHITGLKGSIRWWYEALIRGLEYYGCDPTAAKEENGRPKRCELDLKKLESRTDKEVKKQLCPACYLFGCTGWSGKFNLRVLELDSNKPIGGLNGSGISFRLAFVKKKAFLEAEEKLLNATLKVIVDYGAIGGKLGLKPSEQTGKNNKFHHKDFGIIARSTNSNLPDSKILDKEKIEAYLKTFKKLNNNTEWPDLRNFWFVKGRHINRADHNELVGRDLNRGRYISNKASITEHKVFLGGFIPMEKNDFIRNLSTEKQAFYNSVNASSKKIFSFHGSSKGAPVERCFGYERNSALLTDLLKSDLFKELSLTLWKDLEREFYVQL